MIPTNGVTPQKGIVGGRIATEALLAPALVIHQRNEQTLCVQPRTGYVYDKHMMLHRDEYGDPMLPEDQHPEQPSRISRIMHTILEADLLKCMLRLQIRSASREEACLIHSAQLWDELEITSTLDQAVLDDREFRQHLRYHSLYVNHHTATCAKLSLGGVLVSAIAVAEKRVSNAFAIVRPPGHHADPDQSSGFCFFNNVAVTAKYLLCHYREGPAPIQRILILDWDIHHGNGTQTAFYDDPNVLFVSIHRFDIRGGERFYPGRPEADMTFVGEGAGRGKNVNIPWDQAAMGDADYLYAFDTIVMPLAREFAPDFVLISAGFDAAKGDELGGCLVSPAGYAHMTHRLASLAGGRLVAALEGGYNIEAISQSALACIRVMLGDAPPALPSLAPCASAVKTIHDVVAIQSRFWKTMRPRYEPLSDDILPLATELNRALLPFEAIVKRKHSQMISVALGEPTLSSHFDRQVFVSSSIRTATKAILWIHEGSVLSIKLNAATGEPASSESFIYDKSELIYRLSNDQQWAVVDVNVTLPAPLHSHSKEGKRLRTALIAHVWHSLFRNSDISMSEIDRVVIIADGRGCQAFSDVMADVDLADLEQISAACVLTPSPLQPLRPLRATAGWSKKSVLHIASESTDAKTDAKTLRRQAMLKTTYAEVILTNGQASTHNLIKEWPFIAHFVCARMVIDQVPAKLD
ncbi:hypothetical protein E5Q_00886 [Mixia osmundae IAM 14324]|uniref:histone deacetylase n=1 Tax=Mixia osmundae (strain CBS 9802 / IAM 14324 / JCM 22182 / KY 12970) TaxID=764103 RepID=G7DUH7_MIXOS|nr:hypothetical protein E5Q_00886 [Mixia osmundae IAM 14324]